MPTAPHNAKRRRQIGLFCLNGLFLMLEHLLHHLHALFGGRGRLSALTAHRTPSHHALAHHPVALASSTGMPHTGSAAIAPPFAAVLSGFNDIRGNGVSGYN
jgi:hypothetical protein